MMCKDLTNSLPKELEKICFKPVLHWFCRLKLYNKPITAV